MFTRVCSPPIVPGITGWTSGLGSGKGVRFNFKNNNNNNHFIGKNGITYFDKSLAPGVTAQSWHVISAEAFSQLCYVG